MQSAVKCHELNMRYEQVSVNNVLVNLRERVHVKRDHEEQGQHGCGLLSIRVPHQGISPHAFLSLEFPQLFFQVLIFISQ